MTQNDLKGFRFRESTRAPFDTEVKLRFDRFGGAVSGFSADISMEGMFVRTEDPKPVGTLVQFEFTIGDESELIQGLGDVVWVRTRQLAANKPPGMGIQFRYVDPHSRELIFKIVDKYLKETKEGEASGTASSPESPPAAPVVGEASPPPSGAPPSPEPAAAAGDSEDVLSLGGLELPELDSPLPSLSDEPTAEPPATAPPAAPPSPIEQPVPAAAEPPAAAPSPPVPPARPAPPPPAEAPPSFIADLGGEGSGGSAVPPPSSVGTPTTASETVRTGRPLFDADDLLREPAPFGSPPAGGAEWDDEPASPPVSPYAGMGGAGSARKSASGRGPLLLILIVIVALGAAAGVYFREPIRSLLPWVGEDGAEVETGAAGPLPAAEAGNAAEAASRAEPPAGTTAEPGGAQEPAPDLSSPETVPMAPDEEGGEDPRQRAVQQVPPPVEPAVSEPRPTSGNGPTEVREIRTARLPSETVVTIETDGVILPEGYSQVRLDSPPRLLVRLLGITEPQRSRIPVGTPHLREIRTGLHPGQLHIVFDLAAPGVESRVQPEGNRLTVRFLE